MWLESWEKWALAQIYVLWVCYTSVFPKTFSQLWFSLYPSEARNFISFSLLVLLFLYAETTTKRNKLSKHIVRCQLLLFSRSVVFNSLQPHGLQHASLPCPTLFHRVCLNSCPLSQWCHSTISSSVTLFSSCLQSFPASGSFPMSQFFSSGGQVLELQLQHQSFQWIFRTDFL